MSQPAVALTRAQIVAWRNAIFVIFGLTGLGMASWIARLPAVRDALEIRIDQVGILIFGMAAGSIIGLAFSSHIIARLGARRTLTAALVSFCVGLTVVGFGATVGPVFAVTLIGLVVFGAAMGLTDVAMNVSGGANERALGRAIMPIFHGFFSIGTMIGAGISVLAELNRVPIALHLGGMAVIILAATVCVVRFVPAENPSDGGSQVGAEVDHSQTWRGRLSIWRDPRTLLIGVIVLGAAFAEGSANDWLALSMVDGHGVDNPTGALVFGIFVTAMTAGRLGGVILLDRFGRVTVLRASFLLSAIAILAIIVIPSAIVAAIAAVFWGLGAALGFPVGMSAASDDPKTAAARVSAVATIGYFAFLVGPPLIGFLGQQVGLLNALYVVLVLSAIGAFVSGAAREPAAAASDAAVPKRMDTMVDPVDAPKI